MKDCRTIWVFTPSRTDPKDLEFILVQRQAIVQDAVERVRESALTDHKHHLLFVGPRGCGKTHLVTLIVNRLSGDVELTEHLRIAWLNEDETCTTFLEFLLKVHAALEKRYPHDFPQAMLSPVYDMKPNAAQDFVTKHLLSALGSRTLVVVTENLDAIFEELADAGQKQLRSFIQENPRLSIVATAQRLLGDLSNRTSPFFGFFQTEHLKPLNVEQATELLQNIARLQEKGSVVEFLATSRGRSRVRAIHHLSGGNHRIYIVLSQFITRDSVDALLEPFMRMVDELTPYYQERIRWLPPLQRKIIEYLCICEGTVPVKEIAKRLFATPQTISSQLQDLREKGYVEANQRGRESLYEIAEPLMRICVEVKDNQRFQPLRLLVDFLRVWYDDHELKHRLGKIKPASASCAYLQFAIQRNSAEGNLRKQILLEEFQSSFPEKLPTAIRDEMIHELKDAPEGFLLAVHSLREGKPIEAIRCLDEAISDEATPADTVELLLSRAEIHCLMGNYDKGIDDYTRAIDLPGALVVQVAKALIRRAITHGESGDTQREIDDYTAAIRLPGAPADQVATALLFRGTIKHKSGDAQCALADYTAVISLPDAPVDQVAKALVNRALTFATVGNFQRAIDDCTAIINLPCAPIKQVFKARVLRSFVHHHTGDIQLAIDDSTAAIDLPGAPVDQVAVAFLFRGIARGEAGDEQRARDDYTAIINLKAAPVDCIARALINRAITYGKAGETQREIDDYTSLIDLPAAPADQVAVALIFRGISYGQCGDIQREIDDYTAVIGLQGAPLEQVAKALMCRGLTYGQTGDLQRAINDYTAVIHLNGVPVEQAARALVNRGLAHGETGNIQREIDDYTAVIGLQGAPADQVAVALLFRGITYGQTGDTRREVDDYTAVIGMQGVPAEQVAKALVNRGSTYGKTGDMQRAIDDYTAVIRLNTAPVEQIAEALYSRGVIYFQQNLKQQSLADFEAVIGLPKASVEKIVDAHLALSELHFSEGRWSNGFDALNASLDCGAKAQPTYRETATDLIGVVFSAGLSPEGRRDKVTGIVRAYEKHLALPVLGEAIVQHIGDLFRAGEPFPSADNLEAWASAWEQAAESVPDFRLSVRLLRTGADYIKAGGDPGILLALTTPERTILEQALGFADKS